MGVHRPRRVATLEEQGRIRELRAGGASWDAIGTALGMSRSWVTMEALRLGVWIPGSNAMPPRPAPEGDGVSLVRRGHGKDPLPAMSALSVAVLREAGLPIRAST